MKAFALLLGMTIFSPLAFAIQAQPVPIPEDPSSSPQIDIAGVGVGTAGYAKDSDSPSGKARADFADSSLQIGAAQRLFEGGAVGSAGFGFVTTEEAGQAGNGPFFLHQAFVDYQAERFEALLGRTDSPTAHPVDFPTLRSDDLITLTTPLDPFSNGKNPEEHRYSNVASFTLNQGLRYFENFHVQRWIRSADNSSDNGINSFGAAFQVLGEPGLEGFQLVPSATLGYERVVTHSGSTSGLNQAYAGAKISLNQSVVNHLELGLQDIFAWGSGLRAFSSATDSFQANSHAVAASLRFLHSPFGRPSYLIALTGAFKNYQRIGDARSFGYALTGVRRLGHGFDLVAQYDGVSRDAALATAQSGGIALEQKAEVGFAFNFDATFNEHIAPRRSLLNQKHGFLSE
jgi:hypothetical protein